MEPSDNQEVNAAILHSLERNLVATEPEHVLWIDLDRAQKTALGWKHDRLEWNGQGKGSKSSCLRESLTQEISSV